MTTRTLPYELDPLAACRAEPELFPFLLQSADHGTSQGRYDFLLARPDPRMLVLHADGRLTGPHADTADGDFLVALDRWWRTAQSTSRGDPHPDLPFRGGWFLFMGYEIAGQIEPSLRLPCRGELPVAVAARAPAAWVRDHASRTARLVWEHDCDPAIPVLLEKLLRDGSTAPEPTLVLSGPLAEEEAEHYVQQVVRAQRYIHDGDIFQANLSRYWHAQLAPAVNALDLYARLRWANPAPFAGLALLGDMAVVSSSPERLVRVTGTRVDTRPIAGTRPRGADAARDAALVQELINHPKERAEHIMLLDMERNDLGRIAEPGSVRVDELMVVESYTHVHHIVSNVSGRLRDGVSPGQLLRAVFPGGTITGCPKVRCMQIIAELEQAPRGAYSGAMGYLDLEGDLDMNILIRTLVQTGRRLGFRAGAGIVADSVPQHELEETRAKARGLARALGADA